MRASFRTTACILLILILCLTASFAFAKDYDNAAYYSVTWDEFTVNGDVKFYFSTVKDTWDKVMWAYDSDHTEYVRNINAMVNQFIANKNSLIWYGWVDQDGYWNGHVNGTPHVKNLITGETVTVQKWDVTLLQQGNVRGADYLLGEWTTSGTGAVIDADSIPAGKKEKGYVMDIQNGKAKFQRKLTVKLYLSDGNTIKLSFHSESAGMDQYDAITAKGGRGTIQLHWTYDQTQRDLVNFPYIGNVSASFIYLNEPTPIYSNHFYLEKTVDGAADGAKYSFPVEISVDGGKPMTVYIDTEGNGTFTKEITFNGMEKSYTITATEKAQKMPENIVIVTGKDTAVTSDTSVEQTDNNTATLSNRYVEPTPTPKPTATPTATPKPTTTPTPPLPTTGDNSPLPVLVLMALLSCTLLVVAGKKRA